MIKVQISGGLLTDYKSWRDRWGRYSRIGHLKLASALKKLIKSGCYRVGTNVFASNLSAMQNVIPFVGAPSQSDIMIVWRVSI